MPPLREEETIAAAVLQRLIVERDTIDAEEARAVQAIDTLRARISQLETDKGRESSLGSDADEMITQLNWEKEALVKATDGHDAKLEAARERAATLGEALREKETGLETATEELARAEARHHTLRRRFEEAQSQAQKAQDEASRPFRALRGKPRLSKPKQMRWRNFWRVTAALRRRFWMR